MPLAVTDVFADLPDPRLDRNKLHRLTDILTIALCAVLCGANTWEQIAAYGTAKRDWFAAFLALPNGIPSHDTFYRVFTALDPKAFAERFGRWMAAACQATGLVPIAIDGKSARRAKRNTATGCLHLVGAWATENRLTLGQVAVADGSNEVAAIPELLRTLELTGALVTIDAAGCQKGIAAQIVAKEADYVLALKENQPALHEQVTGHFVQLFDGRGPVDKMRHHQEVETGHGRTETRDTYVAPAPQALVATEVWAGLASLVMVMRHCVDHATGQVSDEVRYFISSLPAKVKQLARAVRQHWGIENGLHWVLDVAFHEDRMRQRDRHGIENLALLNRLAVSLLRQDKTVKAGVKCKRKAAGWDDKYLLHLLLHSQ